MRAVLSSLLLILMAVAVRGAEPLWVTPGTWGTVYFGYQNAAKEWVIPPRFTQAKSFGSDDVAPVKENDRWKVIDRSGKTVFSFGEDWSIADIEPFSDGVAMVTIGIQGFSRYVDRKGKPVGEVVTYAGFFSEGLGAFSNYATARKDARFGYLDHRGTVVIAPRFRWAGPFLNGTAPVIFEDGAAWFIDKTGAGKIRVDGVEFLLPVRDGLALALASGGAWGFVDPSGAQAIPFQFLEARSFFDGLAAVKIPGNRPWGYIDRTGKVAIPHQFDSADSFENGRAWVILKGDRCAIDRTGTVVWSMKAEIPATMTSPDDYRPKKVLPPEAPVAVASPLGPPASFLERLPSLKGRTPVTRSSGDRQVLEYGFMRNRLRLFVANDQVTRLELVALLRKPQEAKNVVRMRLEPGVGMVPVKGPVTDIEAEQASALELLVSSLSVAAKTADEDGIRSWISGLWQPPTTVTRSINGRTIFARVANYLPWDGMGSDKEGQLIIVTCDANPAAGFASPATELPLWLIGSWSEQRNYTPTPQVNVTDDMWETIIPKRASVDGRESVTLEAIDAAFQISDTLVVVCTTLRGSEPRRERNFVAGKLPADVLHIGAPGAGGYDRVPMRIGVRFDLIDNQVQVVTAYRGRPAYVAGLRPGDIIRSIDGAPAATVKDAITAIADKTKTQVEVQYTRAGVAATVIVRPATPAP